MTRAPVEAQTAFGPMVIAACEQHLPHISGCSTTPTPPAGYRRDNGLSSVPADRGRCTGCS